MLIENEDYKNVTFFPVGDKLLSYYISIYIWLIIGYFSERLDYETYRLIGAGIIGMAITFAICWLIFNFRGIRNE